MSAVLLAEWTKLRTVRGPFWLLLGVVALTGAVGAAVSGAVRCQAAGCDLDPARVSLAGIQVGQAVVVVLAVLLVGGEYSTGMITTTLTAVPRRTRVLTAKAAVLTGPTLVAAALAVPASLLAGRLLLPGRGLTPRNGYAAVLPLDATTVRVAAGSILYLALIALLSLGVAVLVRDSATATGLVLALLYLAPVLSHVIADPHWQRRIDQLAPSTAGMAVQATLHTHTLPIGPWAGLGVLALWATAALLGAATALTLRDA